VIDRFGVQGGIFLLLGAIIYVILMNVWYFRVLKSTPPGTTARKRGMTGYLIGAVATFYTATLALVLFIRGWGPELPWMLLLMLPGAGMVFYQIKSIKITR
jgi:hypothetical protein